MARKTDLSEPIRAKFYKRLFEFQQTLERFNEIRTKLADMLDDAISSGKVVVKTARDVQVLTESFARLAETEGRLTELIIKLVQILNERDALTIALITASTGQTALPSFDSQLLVPVVDEAMALPDESEQEG